MKSGLRIDVIISDMGRQEGPREGQVLLRKIRARGIETPFIIYAGADDPRHEAEASIRQTGGGSVCPPVAPEVCVPW